VRVTGGRPLRGLAQVEYLRHCPKECILKYTEYESAEKFLDVCRPVFEEKEPLYGLLLGITLRLVDNPLHYGSQPFLATIHHHDILQLIALMTPPHKLQIALPDQGSSQSIQFLAERLYESRWPIPAVLGEADTVRAFADCWNAVAGMSSSEGMKQKIYELRAVRSIPYPEGIMRQVGMSDFDLVEKWVNAFYRDCFGESGPEVTSHHVDTIINDGHLYFWTHPDPVSMAGFTRPTAHGISIGHVYTPPECRNRGYASAVVARLSQKALDDGKRFCTLYTDMSNPTSNSIYQRIGYNAIAEVMDVHFCEA